MQYRSSENYISEHIVYIYYRVDGKEISRLLPRKREKLFIFQVLRTNFKFHLNYHRGDVFAYNRSNNVTR